MQLSEEDFHYWLTRYFRAWKTNAASQVGALFADDADYFYGPFKEPAVGREQIVENWVSDPLAQQHIVAQFEVIAVRDQVGVCHWNVTYQEEADPGRTNELDGILVVKFNSAEECTEHKEWYSRRQIRAKNGPA